MMMMFRVMRTLVWKHTVTLIADDYCTVHTTSL